MSKTTLSSVGNLIDTTTSTNTINANNAAIQAAIDNTLSRDGTQPNTMNANIDMNSHNILNLASPASPGEPLRLADVTLLNGSGTITALPTGGAASQILTKNSSSNYDASWQNSPATTVNLSNSFGGRLTLQAGKPVMTTDAIGSQTIYYAPYTGKTLPTYTSGVWTIRNFTANSTDQTGLSLSLAGSANWAAGSTHDVFAIMDAGTLKLATRPWDSSMLPAETLITPNTGNTITTGTTPNAWTNPTAAFDGNNSKVAANCAMNVNSGINSWIGQDWGVGVTNVVSKVILYTPSDQPSWSIGSPNWTYVVSGSNDNVNWHLITVVRLNDVTSANVMPIPMSVTETQPWRYYRVGSDGNGTNPVRFAQIEFYKKNLPVTRRLVLNDGLLVNDALMTARTSSSTTVSVAQYEGIYLGTITIDNATAGQVTAHATFGPSRVYGIWNNYNRVVLTANAGTYATFSTYSPTVQRWVTSENATAGNSFSAQIVLGIAEEEIFSEFHRTMFFDCAGSPAGMEFGIGVDTNLNFSGTEGINNIDLPPAQMGFTPRGWVKVPAQAGVRTLYGLERWNGGAGIISLFTGPRSTALRAQWRG
jgi:hypothetical protein